MTQTIKTRPIPAVTRLSLDQLGKLWQHVDRVTCYQNNKKYGKQITATERRVRLGKLAPKPRYLIGRRPTVRPGLVDGNFNGNGNLFTMSTTTQSRAIRQRNHLNIEKTRARSYLNAMATTQRSPSRWWRCGARDKRQMISAQDRSQMLTRWPGAVWCHSRLPCSWSYSHWLGRGRPWIEQICAMFCCGLVGASMKIN